MAKKPPHRRSASKPLGVLQMDDGLVIGTTQAAISVIEDAKRSGVNDKVELERVFVEAGLKFKPKEIYKGAIVIGPKIGSLDNRGKARIKGLNAPEKRVKLQSVDSIPNQVVRVNLRDIAPVIERYDRNDHDSLRKVCTEIAKHDQSESLEKPEPFSKDKPIIKWADRHQRVPQVGENPLKFIRVAYGDEAIKKTLHTNIIEERDPALSRAYGRHMTLVKKGKAELEPGFPLPNAKEWKNRQPKLSDETMRRARAQDKADQRSR